MMNSKLRHVNGRQQQFHRPAKEEAERRFKAQLALVAETRVSPVKRGSLERSKNVKKQSNGHKNATYKRRKHKSVDSDSEPPAPKRINSSRNEEQPIVTREFKIVISLEDQLMALKHIHKAKFFTFNGQTHRYCADTDTWTIDGVPTYKIDFDNPPNYYDDQDATDDENFADNNDPILEESLHDQILDALNSVVTNGHKNSPHVTDVAIAGPSKGLIGRACTPPRETSAMSLNGSLELSPTCIITGSDVSLAKITSVDLVSLNTHENSDPQLDPLGTCSNTYNMDFEFAQLGLDILTNED